MESKKQEDKPTSEIPKVEEEKKDAPVSYDPFAGMTPDEKRKNMKESIQTLINQMEPRIQTTSERRNLDKLKHLIPLYESHQFWDTQPVPKNTNITDTVEKEGEIEHKEVKDVQKEASKLPAGFEWATVDLSDEKQLKEVFDLLKKNYVEDADGTFRFEYQAEFIRWALLVPGHIKEWHLGVRATESKKLLAFIAGSPVKSKIKERNVKLAQINFLCISKKLREKKLAPMMIKEITRRVNLSGVFQAVYTAGVVIPRPIGTATYLHRSLNPKKLIEIGFSALPMGETMANHIKKNKVPSLDDIKVKGNFREMQKKDISTVLKLLNNFLKQFKLHPIYNQEEIAHLLMPREGVVYTYVVEDENTKEVTDFTSFYVLPTQILQQEGH